MLFVNLLKINVQKDIWNVHKIVVLLELHYLIIPVKGSHQSRVKFSYIPYYSLNLSIFIMLQWTILKIDVTCQIMLSTLNKVIIIIIIIIINIIIIISKLYGVAQST